MTKFFIGALLGIVLLGCSQEQAPTPTNQSTATATAQPVATNNNSANHLLVLFIDPNGGPCQMQERILSQMDAELQGKVLIRPVKTTVPADMNIFYAYGIRALPGIILTDLEGKEIKRLPPGVQDAAAIRNLIDQIPRG